MRLTGFQMEMVQDVIDEGAEEIHVCGVASVEVMDVDQVRVTYFANKKCGKVVAIHLIWGMHAWMGWWAVWDQSRHTLAQECAEAGRVARAFAAAIMN